jgi:hypothetical protein
MRPRHGAESIFQAAGAEPPWISSASRCRDWYGGQRGRNDNRGAVANDWSCAYRIWPYPFSNRICPHLATTLLGVRSKGNGRWMAGRNERWDQGQTLSIYLMTLFQMTCGVSLTGTIRCGLGGVVEQACCVIPQDLKREDLPCGLPFVECKTLGWE